MIDTQSDGARAPVAVAHVELQLDRDGRPAGTVQAADAAPVSFVGWLALIAELSGLVSGPPATHRPG